MQAKRTTAIVAAVAAMAPEDEIHLSREKGFFAGGASQDDILRQINPHTPLMRPELRRHIVLHMWSAHAPRRPPPPPPPPSS